MQKLFQGFFKWIIAGIGIGIGMFVVLVLVTALGKYSKDKKESEQDKEVVETTEAIPLTNQSFEKAQFEVAPVGYKLIEDGEIILDMPILGMEWETVKDENTKAVLRIYEPFSVYQCTTKDGEKLQLEVVNSDIGYMLKFYFATSGNELKLQAQQATEEAYYTVNSNNILLIMRDPDYYYMFTQYEGGDTSLYIKSAITAHEINNFYCEYNSAEGEGYALINQMVPEHFKFKPMTDELKEFLLYS